MSWPDLTTFPDTELDLTPDEVLLTYDGAPVLFTTPPPQKLAICVEETERGLRYLVVPISNESLERLKSNTLSVRDALHHDPLWVVDPPLRAKQVPFALIPEDALPVPGTLLYREDQIGSDRSSPP